MLRRGLATGGGAAAVTMVGWFGEHTASRSTSRIASRTMESAAAKNQQLFQQPKKFFSSTTTTSSAAKPSSPPPPVTETVAKPSSSPSFVQWYEGHLEKRPVLTKSITGSILWGIGDIVAQLIPQLAFESDDGENKEALTYDLVRTGRAVAFGGFIHAPTSHVHFNLLEWMTVRTGLSGLAIPVFKTVMEQVGNGIAFGIVVAELLEGLLSTGMSDKLLFFFFFLLLLFEIVCVLELDFKFHVSWCHGCDARDDTYPDL
jgi:hypothetical protein